MTQIQKLILKLFGRWGTYAMCPKDSQPLDMGIEIQHIGAHRSVAVKIRPDGKWHWVWFKKTTGETQLVEKVE